MRRKPVENAHNAGDEGEWEEPETKLIPTEHNTKGDVLAATRRSHFQAHPALESTRHFTLIPRWNQISISGSFMDWKVLLFEF